jgi:hypothetical protein
VAGEEAFPVPTVAVIFDYDDTLVPDSTTALLSKYGIDVNKFWKKDSKLLVSREYDPALAYLRLLLDNVGRGKPLGQLTLAGLKTFGATLGSKTFPGLPSLFDDLRKIVAKYQGIDVKFFVISGGLQEVIEGNSAIAPYLSGIYAAQLDGETDGGPVRYAKRCVTFTEKIRYLFEINKGLRPADTKRNPYLVNKDIPEPRRPISFKRLRHLGKGHGAKVSTSTAFVPPETTRQKRLVE